MSDVGQIDLQSEQFSALIHGLEVRSKNNWYTFGRYRSFLPIVLIILLLNADPQPIFELIPRFRELIETNSFRVAL